MAGTQKGYKLNIHKYYTYNTLDNTMFGFVLGVTQVLPAVSVNKAIEMWLERFNLCDDLYCVEAARATFYRIMKSLKDKEMDDVDCYEIKNKPYEQVKK